MTAERQGEVIAKLADFGLARRVTISAQNMGGAERISARVMFRDNFGLGIVRGVEEDLATQ